MKRYDERQNFISAEWEEQQNCISQLKQMQAQDILAFMTSEYERHTTDMQTTEAKQNLCINQGKSFPILRMTDPNWGLLSSKTLLETCDATVGDITLAAFQIISGVKTEPWGTLRRVWLTRPL